MSAPAISQTHHSGPQSLAGSIGPAAGGQTGRRIAGNMQDTHDSDSGIGNMYGSAPFHHTRGSHSSVADDTAHSTRGRTDSWTGSAPHPHPYREPMRAGDGYSNRGFSREASPLARESHNGYRETHRDTYRDTQIEFREPRQYREEDRFREQERYRDSSPMSERYPPNYREPSPYRHETSSLGGLRFGSRSRDNTPPRGESRETPRDVLAPRGNDRLMRELRATVDEGEGRRQLLMSKLKDAQEIITVQSEKLHQLESSLKVTTLQLEELKLKEREYSRRISELENDKTSTQQLKLDTLKLRETLQDKMETLQLELRQMEASYNGLQLDYRKQSEALDEAVRKGFKLEEENAKVQKELRVLSRDTSESREQLERAKRRRQELEERATEQRAELDVLREETRNSDMRITALTNQVAELNRSNSELKQEMETLLGSLKQASEEKQKLLSQLKLLQEGQTDMRARMASAATERERLHSELEEMKRKLDESRHETRKLRSNATSSEEEARELHEQLKCSRIEARDTKELADKTNDELEATKKVSEQLSSELRSAQLSLGAAEERCTMIEQAKQLQIQQRQVAEDSRRNLEKELDILRGTLEALKSEHETEKENLQEAVIKLKGDLSSIRDQRTELERKCQKLEEELKKSQKELENQSSLQQDELETWRNNAERLTGSLRKKEEELGVLHSRIRDMESEYTQMRAEYDHYADQYNNVNELRDELERIQLENRRLTQDNAENEQVISLLETQKRMLTNGEMRSLMSSTDTLNVLDNEKYKEVAKENEDLKEKVTELETIRDDLIKQKQEMLAKSDMFYETQSGEDLQRRYDQLQNNYSELQQRCSDLTEDCSEMQSRRQHDTEMLQQLSQEKEDLQKKIDSIDLKTPSQNIERLSDEKYQLEKEVDRLKASVRELEQTSRLQESQDSMALAESSASLRRLQREKESLENQVSLVRGQVVIVENAKKRSEDQTHRLERELDRVKNELSCQDSVRSSALVAAREEVDRLQQQLLDSHERYEKQERLVKSLRQESEELQSQKAKHLQRGKKDSFDDVGMELSGLREKLQNLESVIQSKDATIERLEQDLSKAHNETAERDQELRDLQGQMVTFEVPEGGTIDLGDGNQVILVDGDGNAILSDSRAVGNESGLVMEDGEDYYWIHEEEDSPVSVNKYTRMKKNDVNPELNQYASYTDLNKLGLDPRATLTPIQSVENSIASDEEDTPRARSNTDSSLPDRAIERSSERVPEVQLTTPGGSSAAASSGDEVEQSFFKQPVGDEQETDVHSTASNSGATDTLSEMQQLMRKYLDEKYEHQPMGSLSDSITRIKSARDDNSVSYSTSPSKRSRTFSSPVVPSEQNIAQNIGSLRERVAMFEHASPKAGNKKVSFSDDTKGGLDSPRSPRTPRTSPRDDPSTVSADSPRDESPKASPRSNKDIKPLPSRAVKPNDRERPARVVKPVSRPEKKTKSPLPPVRTARVPPATAPKTSKKEPRVSVNRSSELRKNAISKRDVKPETRPSSSSLRNQRSNDTTESAGRIPRIKKPLTPPEVLLTGRKRSSDRSAQSSETSENTVNKGKDIEELNEANCSQVEETEDSVSIGDDKPAPAMSKWTTIDLKQDVASDSEQSSSLLGSGSLNDLWTTVIAADTSNQSLEQSSHEARADNSSTSSLFGSVISRVSAEVQDLMVPHPPTSAAQPAPVNLGVSRLMSKSPSPLLGEARSFTPSPPPRMGRNALLRHDNPANQSIGLSLLKARACLTTDDL